MIDHPESPWKCLSCCRSLDLDNGISLDGSTTPHLCETCWAVLTTAERLDQIRQWTLAQRQEEALQAVADLCRAACSAECLHRLGDPNSDFRGRN